MPKIDLSEAVFSLAWSFQGREWEPEELLELGWTEELQQLIEDRARVMAAAAETTEIEVEEIESGAKQSHTQHTT